MLDDNLFTLAVQAHGTLTIAIGHGFTDQHTTPLGAASAPRVPRWRDGRPVNGPAQGRALRILATVAVIICSLCGALVIADGEGQHDLLHRAQLQPDDDAAERADRALRDGPVQIGIDVGRIPSGDDPA